METVFQLNSSTCRTDRNLTSVNSQEKVSAKNLSFTQIIQFRNIGAYLDHKWYKSANRQQV